LFKILAEAQGDDVDVENAGEGLKISQKTWRLMRGLPTSHPSVFECWNGLWQGILAAHNPHLRWTVTKRLDLGAPSFEWMVGVADSGGG
jgi:hypothetical protein